MGNNLTITILRSEYQYLLKCKKRAEGIRESQKKWADANREHVRAMARKCYKQRKENSNE